MGGEERQSIVLVTLDTTRADHLGCYGYFRETSPRLDAFSEKCLLFERCLAPMATTLPTHTSILTGTYPLEHGVLANVAHGGRRFAPSQDLRSFAEILADGGYRTAAFVSAAPLRSGTGVEAGFDVYDEPTGAQRRAAETTERALEWLDGREAGPFFLWVHYYDPHYPFRAPPPFSDAFETDRELDLFLKERRIPGKGEREILGPDGAPAGSVTERTVESMNAYDAEILYTDSEFGRLLDRLREDPDWASTCVVVVGDHGEGLAQHGEVAHGGTWDEQLRVPMMIRVPGEAPRRIEGTLSAVGVLPALAEFADGFPWKEFLGQTSGHAGAGSEGVLSHDTGRKIGLPGYRYALTGDRWKYLRVIGEGTDFEESLFDLRADPHELEDVAARNPKTVAALAEEMDRVIASQGSRGQELRARAGEEDEPVDSVVLEQLRSLGYLSD